MPGSGKSEAGNFFAQQGIAVLSFGSITKQGLKRKKLAPSEKNECRFREQLRKKLGMAAYAILLWPDIKQAFDKNQLVVAEGMRSWEEYIFLKKKVTNVYLVAILSSAKIRQQRLLTRKERSVDTAKIRERDRKEMALNLCPTILFSDYFIVNDGEKKELYRTLDKIKKVLTDK